jgi:AcrR family transcriptional regulator
MELIHPTKVALLDTVIKLLETKSLEDITSDEVLRVSGVSRGSMYHHFADFGDVLEQAQVRRFGRYIDESIAALVQVAFSSPTREELRSGLQRITRATQDAGFGNRRFDRVMPYGAAANNPRMRETLGREQERLTSAIADLVTDAQNNGYFTTEFSPRTIAVMIQAYTMGKIVDDVTPNHVDAEEWNLMIDALLDRLFGVDGLDHSGK